MNKSIRQGRTNAMRAQKRRAIDSAQLRLITAWNGTPPGTQVVVVLEDGREQITRTTTQPSLLNGKAIVWLSGLVGWYPLSRVRRVEMEQAACAQ